MLQPGRRAIDPDLMARPFRIPSSASASIESDRPLRRYLGGNLTGDACSPRIEATIDDGAAALDTSTAHGAGGGLSRHAPFEWCRRYDPRLPHLDRAAWVVLVTPALLTRISKTDPMYSGYTRQSQLRRSRDRRASERAALRFTRITDALADQLDIHPTCTRLLLQPRAPDAARRSAKNAPSRLLGRR